MDRNCQGSRQYTYPLTQPKCTPITTVSFGHQVHVNAHMFPKRQQAYAEGKACIIINTFYCARPHVHWYADSWIRSW